MSNSDAHEGLTDFQMGYRRGLYDGRREKAGASGIEQDFAYKSSEYEQGYWFGFKDGRQ